MSEVKNSITDIDNNVQMESIQTPEPSPAKTPRKRISRAEKARLESEELLKSLGVTMETGRQTRSSRRGPVVESPKPEPVKRKQINTPKRSKKTKVSESDSVDGANHAKESKQDGAQIVPVQTTTSNKVEKVDQIPAEEEAVESAPAPKKAEVPKMEVDTPIESTQAASVPPPKPQPIALLLPAPIIQVESVPVKVVEQPEVLESVGVSAAADTTTAIVIDSEPSIEEPSQTNADADETIELQSSPSDDDSKEATNPRKAISQPDAIVELESSSNEGDTKDEVVAKTHDIDSLDLEMINSDSSHSANEIQIDEIPASQAVPEQPLPTSTVEPDVTEVTEIVDEPAIATNNNANNSVHACESPENSVVSTNNQPSIALPEKLCTITVGSPVEETITTTTTSETLLKQPNATTV